MQTELVILAAGMSSRYQGLKQLDAMDDFGYSIMDFSVYDAIKTGFDGVTFVIREGTEETFRSAIEPKLKGVRIQYAVQRSADIPSGMVVPPERSKPWGTGQAILCCRDLVDTPFAVINADDFYGRGSIAAIHAHLSRQTADSRHWCMLGYRLADTVLTDRPVGRAICDIDAEEYMQSLRELRLSKTAKGYGYCEGEKWIETDGNAIVSMNIWGFTPTVFDVLQRGFEDFFRIHTDDIGTAEYQLADAVNSALASGIADVRMYPAVDEWFGVTYRTDKDAVREKIAGMRAAGIYPDLLFD